MKTLKNVLKIAIPLIGLTYFNCNIEEESNQKIIPKITASASTTHGKYERTYRWDKILDEKEEKYKIEKGLLKGLAMIESYGDPLRLNESSDGGAGLFMFQPGTAKYCGLDIYGNSNKTGKDKEHGKKLEKVIRENKYNYEKMEEIDERFDVYKSSEAAAKFLKALYGKHGSWDKALSAYNRGTPAKYPCLTNHVHFTRKYQKYYNKKDN